MAGLLLSCTFNNNSLKNYSLEKHLWLTTSFYAGPFYDDSQFRLTDPKAFLSIKGVSINGQEMKAPKEDSIIPAGTLVEILDIIYPDFISQIKRPLYSPRKNVWILLKFGLERGLVNIYHEKTHILILPIDIQKEEEVLKYLNQFFSPNDPNHWLLTQREYIKQAIFEKKPVIGMDKNQVIKALGPCTSITQTSNQEEEIWGYDYFVIFFKNDLVYKIQRRSFKN